jgi:hypothetical protein
MCLAGVLAAAVGLAEPSAQMPDGYWNTSADAPAGLPAEFFSAPDAATPLRQDETLDALHLTPGPANWRVAGSALVPRDGAVTRGVSGSGGCGYVSAGSTFTVWNTVPDLPDGLVVNTLRMYYNDTSASNSIGWFTVYDLFGNIVQEWSVSSTGNIGNSFSDSAAINHTIDHSVYSYLLNWRPNVVGSTMQLCGFRVFSTAPLAVPGQPQSLTASVSGRTVALSWLPPGAGGAPASYVVEAGSAPGLANLATVPVIGTSFVAPGVPPGTYYVRVRAVNATGPGAPTADVTIVVS